MAFLEDYKMFSIDKGVPVEQSKFSRSRKSMYPFADMEVGDSFLVPDIDGKPKSVAPSAARFVKAAGNEGKQFVTRRVEGGVRVWRTA